MDQNDGLINGVSANEDGEAEAIPDIFNASSVADIKATLSALQDREASVTARLEALVASQKDFSRELGRLDILRARIGSQASNTRAISHGMLSETAATAHRISSAVHRLDLEQSRVKTTLEMVEQVMELKACVLGVAGSMGASQDWETAASYLNRASRISPEIINGAFAADIVPTAEVPDPPAVTLENAAESLCGLFLREFDRAVKENDGAKITRFFKLFPLIDRSAVGLDVYGRYVCQGVASRARTNLNTGTGGAQSKEGYFYASALTKLFEHIAQIVESHGGLVERHYGPGNMSRVIERLQVEADVQGGIILETWSDEWHVDRKLTDIKSYAFTFLVQSFLPNTRGGPQRTNSPGTRDGASQRTSEDEGVDMKEIDGILNEMSLMLGRWSLYSRFLADKCRAVDSEELVLPNFLLESPLCQKVNERLVSPFNLMTTFFLRRSVEKAFQIDEPPSDLTLNLQRPPTSNPPYITSAVDDIMYIVNKVLEQSLATGHKPIVMNVVPTIARVLGSDFIGMIQRKMRDETYPRPVVPGGPPPEAVVVSFLVLINNLDVAIDYINRILKNFLESDGANGATGEPHNRDSGGRIPHLFPLDNDAEAVAGALRSLSSSFESKAQDLIGDGIQVVFNNVVKTRLRPILADAFRDFEYEPRGGDGDQGGGLDDEEIAASELDSSAGGSEVRRRFMTSWRELLVPISRILTGRAFDRLLGVTIASLARLLEKRIWSYHGRVNALGATRLERDITGVISAAVDIGESYVSADGGGGSRYRHREAFGRCTQIVMVMGLEEEEWDEIEKSGGDMVDKLSAEERSRARAMVV
ncbi:conserved hypothetical protein [Uncinocarpus reesii 1704]|uniref:Conserved oligomeric Golgi complex subunit 4 n=1 Tax=Uncinocarpus reesii (strain UAMH 1704) TaxID=336963 RepID=C4JFD6_UNCRE|nr:uncharacterized protein UREG_00950 [Uncinocarpus reesii 1704]EEP76101.1 conserved hypothetical protein [Uncinocarpus reesii 1704]